MLINWWAYIQGEGLYSEVYGICMFMIFIRDNPDGVR